MYLINQIIFGFLIGTGIFLLFLPLFKPYHNTPSEFLNQQYKYKYFTLGLILVGILIYYISYFCQRDIEGVQELTNWKKMCLGQKWSKLLIEASFMGSESIFIIFGMYMGLYYLKFNIEKNYQNREDTIFNWHEDKFIPRLIRLIFLALGFIPVGIIFLLNLFNVSYLVFYIITPILFFLGGFLTFGLCLIFGYKCTSTKFPRNDLIQLDPQISE